MFRLSFCVVVLLFSINVFAMEGSGTQQEPWRIESVNDFNDFADDPNYWDDFTRLETDINLAGIVYSIAVIAPDTENSGYPFEGNSFSGVFDGNGCVIKNLTIQTNGDDNWFLGLFGQIDGGLIKNLGIEDCNIMGDYYSWGLGGLCGWNEGGTLINCYTTGFVSSGNISDYLGGLCGYNHCGLIINCYSTSTLSGGDDSWTLGGLCGRNDSGTIENCFASSSVIGDYYLGGLCGEITTEGVIRNCKATGSVTGDYGLGGFCGLNSDGIIETSCAAVEVQGGNNAGGFIGEDIDGEYIMSFWDSDINPGLDGIGNGSEPNVVGLPTVEMMKQETFVDAGWDFVGESINGPNDIWTVKEGVKYPEHVWIMVQYVDWDGVDFLDYGFFADYYGVIDCNAANDCNSADLNYSGEVDTNDLKIFRDYWMEGL